MSESIKQATKRNYDGTVARIAGNLLSGALDQGDYQRLGYEPECPEGYAKIIVGAVKVARAIVDETKRTEPQPEPAKVPR